MKEERHGDQKDFDGEEERQALHRPRHRVVSVGPLQRRRVRGEMKNEKHADRDDARHRVEAAGEAARALGHSSGPGVRP